MENLYKLIYNGIIITMNPSREILSDGAIAIQGDRIIAVGSRETAEAAIPGHEYQNIDASGKVILPGFINIHTHAGLSILRGVGEEWATFPSYTKSMPQGVMLPESDMYLLTLLGGVEALRFGTTCIVDNYIYSDQNAKAFEKLNLRAIISERIHDADLFKIPEGIYSFSEEIGDKLLEKNIELIENWHGKNSGLIQCRFGPHAPDTCSEKYLQKIREFANQYQIGLVIHLAQGAFEGIEIAKRTGGLSPVEYLDRVGLLGPDLIAAHCIFVDEHDIQLMSESGLHVSHQPEGNAKYGLMAPLSKMQQAKINVGLGTDNMTADMIEVMRFAVCIGRIKDHTAGYPKALNALEMATINGAKAIGMEKDLGSIELGKKADIVMVDFRKPHLIPLVDPIANLIHTGLGSDVDTVLVDGKILVENGHTLIVDEQEVIKEVQELATRRWKEIANQDIAFNLFKNI